MLNFRIYFILQWAQIRNSDLYIGGALPRSRDVQINIRDVPCNAVENNNSRYNQMT
jgi:hypothetical protein